MKTLFVLISILIVCLSAYSEPQCTADLVQKIRTKDSESIDSVASLKNHLKFYVEKWKKSEASVLKKYDGKNIEELQAREMHLEDSAFILDLANVVVLRNVVADEYLKIKPCLDAKAQ